MIKTIFLTGATGFLGRCIVELLLKRGYKVFALVRSIPKRVYGSRLVFIKGDITKKNLGIGRRDERLLKEAGYVIHCAAITDVRDKSVNLFKTNVVGTKNVLRFAGKFPKLKTFVHISSKSVAGNFEGVFPEDTLPEIKSFHNAYEKSKYQGELLVRKSNLPFIIVRPPTIVGDSKSGMVDKFEGSAYRLISALKKRRLPFYPSKCNGFIYVMPVDKVAEFVVKVCFNSKYIYTTFNITDSSPITFKEFIERASKLLGVPEPSFTLPGSFWDFFMVLASRASFMNAGSLSLLNQKLRYENKAFVSASQKYGIKYPSLVKYLPILIKFYIRNS